MRRRTVGIIVGVAALLIGLVAAVLVAVNLLVPHPDSNGCVVRGDTSCTDIPIETLEQAFDVELPEGTVVLESSYEHFQDWHLEATFELPDGEIALGSEWSSETADDDGVTHHFEYTEKDGATILTLTEFTT